MKALGSEVKTAAETNKESKQRWWLTWGELVVVRSGGRLRSGEGSLGVEEGR